ncbi:hypothetical protein F558DRAFT_00057 [Streptomyces sp. AmelKG-A3]|nr:hypothetical protein GA0115247_118132 [Streptomyces sp. PalvLS-984]SDB86774.1 hypothetical protein F558DRAFT_00057 [Streptomyces sp. AmelKG-A3]
MPRCPDVWHCAAVPGIRARVRCRRAGPQSRDHVEGLSTGSASLASRGRRPPPGRSRGSQSVLRGSQSVLRGSQSMMSRRVFGLSFLFTERLCTYTSSAGLLPAFTETVPWMPVPNRRLRAASPV